MKVATTGTGIKSLFGDLGLEMQSQVNTDSSTARSIASRRGAGRVRHVEVRELWVQDNLNIVKVRGEDNVADVWPSTWIGSIWASTCCFWGSPTVRGDTSSALTLETLRSEICSWICVCSSSSSTDSLLFFPFLQPWHIHELRRFTLDLYSDLDRMG